MKRILYIVIFILINNVSFAAKINVGAIYQNEINIKRNYKIPLPPGKFTVVATNIKKGFRDTLLNQSDENGVVRWQVWVWSSKAANTWWEPSKFCKRKNLYFNNSKIGNKRHHCWIVNHSRSEVTSGKGFWGKVRDWIIREKINQPDIYVYSQHEYQTSGKEIIGMAYFYNPELDGVPAPKNITWDTSEYHMSRVHKFPQHEAFLKKFVNLSASFVERFNQLNNITMMTLNPSEYIIQTSISTEKEIISNSTEDIAKQLKDLKDLLDAGALTKEEFDKAKKKILN